MDQATTAPSATPAANASRSEEAAIVMVVRRRSRSDARSAFHERQNHPQYPLEDVFVGQV